MDMKHRVLAGDERFTCGSNEIRATIKDFWAWSMSRLMGDGPRGDLAEFIVNTALGMDTTIPKKGWGECDIVYEYNGRPVRIEIKCSTYLQAWERPTLSKPVFSIAKTVNCDIGEFEGGYRYIGRDGLPPERRSELYVFCLFAETDRAIADPMNLDQWEFYVVPTALINERLDDQRKISLQGIEKLGIARCSYSEIKGAVDAISSTLT